jgi:hypothetical protein
MLAGPTLGSEGTLGAAGVAGRKSPLYDLSGHLTQGRDIA